jgi:hypothetical protein
MSEMNDNSWTLAFVCVGVLLLYSLSRIIALHRRLRDLEARPPVDDIVMRGMIRQQVNELMSQLEKHKKVLEKNVPAKEEKVENVTPPSPEPEPEVVQPVEEVKKTTKKKSKKTVL